MRLVIAQHHTQENCKFRDLSGDIKSIEEDDVNEKPLDSLTEKYLDQHEIYLLLVSILIHLVSYYVSILNCRT